MRARLCTSLPLNQDRHVAERGVHFALTPAQDARLLALADAGDEAAVMAEVDALEASWDTAWLCESDKAWDAIHRSFCHGQLLYEGGEAPLNQLICGGRQLVLMDEATLSHVSADAVQQVADAAAAITREALHQRYGQIKQRGYAHQLGEADFADAWANFQDLSAFFARAAADRRAVIFTVDC